MKIKILRTKILFVTVIILLIINVQLSEAQNTDAINHEKSLLWEISGKRIKQPSYIFGTIHIIDSTYYTMEESITRKFYECEKLVTEIDMDDPDFQKKSILAAMMKNDSLENLLSKESYNTVNLFFTDSLKIPLQAVRKMKPFYLSEMPVLLSISKNAKSYEQEFVKMAKSRDIEILGISTVEKETEIIDGIGLKVQTQILLESVNPTNIENDKKRILRVLSLYQLHDIDSIYKTMKKAIKHKIVFEVLFPRRHEIWIPNMEKHMNEYSCFFAVGVGHLAGKNGLIELLRGEGYIVSPVFDEDIEH